MTVRVSLALSESAVEVFRTDEKHNANWRRWFKPVAAYADYRPSELREKGMLIPADEAERRVIQTAVKLNEEELLNLLETWAWLNVWSDNHVFGFTKRRPANPRRRDLVREIRLVSDWWDECAQEHAEQYAQEFIDREVPKESQPNYSRMASLLLEAIASEYIRVEGEDFAQ